MCDLNCVGNVLALCLVVEKVGDKKSKKVKKKKFIMFLVEFSQFQISQVVGLKAR